MSEKIFVPSYIAKMAGAFKLTERVKIAVAEDDTKIKVNQVIGKISLIYEKLRNVVDYNDEHLIRKNAIFRILKRLVMIEQRRDGLGLFLLQELIRINYLPNNALPESLAIEVEKVLKKYLFIAYYAENKVGGRAGRKIAYWYLHIASCELEDVLFDFSQRQALTTAMIRVLKRDLELPSKINEHDQNLLLHLTAMRSLLKSDEAILQYYLLTEFYPELFIAEPDRELLENVVDNWSSVKAKLDYYLLHSLKNKLWRLGRKYAVYFLTLREVLVANRDQIDQLLMHPKLLEDKISDVCTRRYKEIRIKVVRAVVRSVVYIFITKMTLAFIIEVPVDYILQNSLNYFALAINIIFPPILMLAISLFIRFPKKKNTEEIVKRVKEVVYEREGDDEKKFHLRDIGSTRKKIVTFIFDVLYVITYGVTFGLVVWFLRKINFNVLSGTFFIFFLCVVSFFAINIRTKAREMIVLDRKEGLINLLFDFFSLPIIKMGQWLSVKLSKINIFVFILDFIIEAPLKIILEVLEDWFSFVREKKEEIY